MDYLQSTKSGCRKSKQQIPSVLTLISEHNYSHGQNLILPFFNRGKFYTQVLLFAFSFSVVEKIILLFTFETAGNEHNKVHKPLTLLLASQKPNFFEIKLKTIKSTHYYNNRDDYFLVKFYQFQPIPMVVT